LLKQWQNGSSSVFKKRNYLFQAKDI